MNLLFDLIESLSKEEKAVLSRYGAMMAGNREDRSRELYGHIKEAEMIVNNGLLPVMKKMLDK